MIQSVSVVGAGTMGSGIALAAAIKNIPVILCDINEAVLAGAKKNIAQNLQVMLDRQKLSAAEKDAAWNHISFTTDINLCKASLVIEAVVEKLLLKTSLFQQLENINTADCILASNTSSLSITAIQKEMDAP